MHELQKKEKIMITLIKTNENLVNVFTKSLPTSIFEKASARYWHEKDEKCAQIRGNTTLTLSHKY
jgi:hypothetical protein